MSDGSGSKSCGSQLEAKLSICCLEVCPLFEWNTKEYRFRYIQFGIAVETVCDAVMKDSLENLEEVKELTSL